MFDFEALRFGYENNLFRVIEAQLGPLPSLETAEARGLLNLRKSGLLGDAVKVTSDLLPEIHEIYQSCLDVIGGGLSGDLFIQHSPQYNANVFGHGGKFDVLIHSSLINDFSPEELRFVFGHELGHVVFDHSRLPVQEIIGNDQRLTPDQIRLLSRWSRAAEISADRLGLLCCGQLGVAVSALFRTSSGLNDIDIDRVLRSLRKQYEDLESLLKTFHDNIYQIRSHPMIPVRFKALELAALDIVALRKNPNQFSLKSFRFVDAQIASTLEMIDMYL